MTPRSSSLAAFLVAACGCAARGPAPDEVGRSASPPYALAAEPQLLLEAPARIDGRIGAVQLEVRLRNDGAAAVGVVADPWLADLRVESERGPIRCAPPSARMKPEPLVELAPGASLPLRVDLGARCYFTASGTYDLEVSFEGAKAPARVQLSLAPRTWVNPGPR